MEDYDVITNGVSDIMVNSYAVRISLHCLFKAVWLPEENLLS